MSQEIVPQVFEVAPRAWPLKTKVMRSGLDDSRVTELWSGIPPRLTMVWSCEGLDCFLRIGDHRCPSGYVAVPRDSRYFVVNQYSMRLTDLNVHGGVTYAGWLNELDSILPEEWAVGFDTSDDTFIGYDGETHPNWTISAAMRETGILAAQIAHPEWKAGDIREVLYESL